MVSKTTTLSYVGLCVATVLWSQPGAYAASFRIGLRADPDILDPAQGGSVAGRMVFAAMCDKLIDTTAGGGFRPQLATAWAWSPDGKTLTLTLRDGVKFQDGQAMDAKSVKTNLDRYRTAAISRRKTELKPVDKVEIIAPKTVALHLSQPYAPLLGVLADRAGMMMSPAVLEKSDQEIGLHPICAGPFSFVDRVAQDHIQLKRFDGYWNRAAIAFDTLIYHPIPDDTVRLLNLRSGDLDMMERLSPTDIEGVRGDANTKVVEGPSLAYDLISINVAHGAKADNPLGRSNKVRQALELSIDKSIINQVAYNGLFVPSNQHEAPGTRFFDADYPVRPRDVEKAKALLQEAGETHPSFTLTVANNPVQQQVAQLIQAMAGESGFKIDIQVTESGTLAADSDAGNYQASIAIWSGRPDPDSNVSPWDDCHGFLNWGEYCNQDLDSVLAKARQGTNPDERKALYDQAVAMYLTDLPHIVLYHYKSLCGLRKNISGFVPYPDGLVRLQGVTKTSQ